MPLSWVVAGVLVLAAAGYVLGRQRAVASAGGDARAMHSLPRYYGANVALFVVTPALGILLAWMLLQPVLIDARAMRLLPEAAIADGANRALLMNEVRQVAEGLDAALSEGTLGASDLTGADGAEVAQALAAAGHPLPAEPAAAVLASARQVRDWTAAGTRWMAAAVILAAVAGFFGALWMTTATFRARNTVETGVLILLIAAACVAIATTVGIVLSMLFETVQFFRDYPWQEFFLGTRWSPDFRGESDLAILPLLWGTLYISAVALLVAVPVGLLAAIYLAEYAGRRMRAVAKPAIEILAGIPTIVYGLFALVTVGPMLRDWIAMPLGLGNSASSVATAGLVMGIMLIPFVSSLSDDVINAVPQTMRDGSFGLGATHGETIRKVILPAALPGIVGAILLAASRAIGETMIVVLGAGAAAAQFDRGLGELVNPFEAMTTVTVKIVSQLTGDTDFASPETLVAFALGLTLFTITLALNVLALWIVRRYREQYE